MAASSATPLFIFYRGILSSCQYSCHYCPFAKKKDTRATLQKDALQLERFVNWVSTQTRPISILFTPWGEVLIRAYYRKALLRLATLPHVYRVAVQTNLHVPLSWLKDAPAGKLALWCSYHPSQTHLAEFLNRCRILRKFNIPHSVGMVAVRENFADIQAMRQSLPAQTYLWLNANNDMGPHYYLPGEIEQLTRIDPWFPYSVHQRASAGCPCHAGENAITVDGSGQVTRCQFLRKPLGNLYRDELKDICTERQCTRRMCDCYIGYAMRKDFPFIEQFGQGVLARIPEMWLSGQM